MSNELAKTEFQNYALANPHNRVYQALKKNVGSSGFDMSDLDRIKFPSGGAQAFEVPGEDGPDYKKEIEGIIVHMQDIRIYWAKGMDEGEAGTPPDCYSGNAITGKGDPGGACGSCPLAEFGSAKGGTGAGQACSLRCMLFIVQKDSPIPKILSLPPTSVKNKDKFMLNRMAAQELDYHDAIVKIGLEIKPGKNGPDYAVATFAKKSVLTDKEREDILVNIGHLMQVFGSISPADVVGGATKGPSPNDPEAEKWE